MVGSLASASIVDNVYLDVVKSIEAMEGGFRVGDIPVLDHV
jgi:hypothetical protein